MFEKLLEPLPLWFVIFPIGNIKIPVWVEATVEGVQATKIKNHTKIDNVCSTESNLYRIWLQKHIQSINLSEISKQIQFSDFIPGYLL